jgi:general secretion pathway protein J
MIMMRQMKRKAGFTLVELLVAIGILAIVAVLGWRGLDSIVRARVALTHEMEQTHGIQLAFAQMQSDCARIVDAKDIGGRRTFAVERERVTLVRSVFTENQPSRMQVVAYRLRDGQLSRYESIATRDVKELDSLWQAALADTSTGQGIPLQSDVEAMTVQSWFSDTPGWRGADAAPPSATAANGEASVPLGLLVALQLRGRSNGMTKIFLLGAA